MSESKRAFNDYKTRWEMLFCINVNTKNEVPRMRSVQFPAKLFESCRIPPWSLYCRVFRQILTRFPTVITRSRNKRLKRNQQRLLQKVMQKVIQFAFANCFHACFKGVLRSHPERYTRNSNSIHFENLPRQCKLNASFLPLDCPFQLRFVE